MTQQLSSEANTDSQTAAPSLPPKPLWVRWSLPSITDVLFLCILGTLLLRSEGTGLLADADTGWHIRNGEQILATHVVSLTDPFSYTRAGQPWFAWEWLYDVLVAAVHHFAGLNGVSMLTVLLVCSTFALLFRFLLRRCGNILVSAGLTMLAAAGSQMHLLARPHVFSWLFTLLWAELLIRFTEGDRKAIYWLPALMLLWVNIHGGFILGVALTALFAAGAFWRYLAARDRTDLRQLWSLVAVGFASLAVTLITPYGYQLHIHVYRYLSSNYLMNRIQEFASPNFHEAGIGYFECFLLLAIAGAALGWRRLRVNDLLLLLFAAHAGLYAGRNIPLAGILISLALCRPLTEIFTSTTPTAERPRFVTRFSSSCNAIAAELAVLEAQLRGHFVVLLVVLAVCVAACNGGRLFGRQLMDEQFSPTHFPVAATQFLAAHHVQDRTFSTDSWSGYLIYRLYPGFKVLVDDRHDFYGDAFIQQYVTSVAGAPGWQKLLDEQHANRALLPPDFALTSLLRQSPEWHVEYSDPVAVLFCRGDACSTPAAAVPPAPTPAH